MSGLQALLKQRFDPTRTGDMDATVEFSWPQGSCRVSVHPGKAVFHDTPEDAPEAELVLYFRDEQQAMDIISGQGNAIDAFMQGDFRSNGYLIWTFQTLSAFSKSSGA